MRQLESKWSILIYNANNVLVNQHNGSVEVLDNQARMEISNNSKCMPVIDDI
jgi:hypothetical protein